MPIRILHSFGLAFVLCAVPLAASAEVVFSEIMYDLPGSDAGHEWVEIHNAGDTAIDISGWKFFEAGVNHKLIPSGTATIPPSGYAIVANNIDVFRADRPGFSGILFKSSFSLSNAGEALALHDESFATAASATYGKSSGGEGNGTSLIFVNGAWVPGVPTPGEANTPAPLSPAEPEPKPATDGNPAGTAEVPHTDGAAEAIPGAISIPAEAPTARADTAEPERGMGNLLPWIAALGAVILLGVGVVFAGKKNGISGYTITEEKS